MPADTNLPPLPDEFNSLPLIVVRDKVRAYALAAQEMERERCAKLCESRASQDADWDTSYWNAAVEGCAAAIRARSEGGEHG
ncbi:MAG: hypothetical protein KGJ38_08255 [Burkholderiaceae bacterium]|nr:hypothetical protein [Burkholderiaceae bacterium]